MLIFSAPAQKCNALRGAIHGFQRELLGNAGGTLLAMTVTMLRVSCKVVLIAAACLVAAAKLRAGGAVSPLAATQEVNRCLTVVRAAAAAKSIQGATSKRTRRADTRDL